MEFSSTFWIPDITDWWHQQEEMHSKYADLSNVAHNIFSIIPHGVGVEASFSLARDVIGWRQSKTIGETLCEEVVVRQFARANNGILAGTDPELDNTNTENNSEMKKEAEEWKLHRMAKVHDFLEMSQVVLATVPDRHFGSRTGSKPIRCQIGDPGRQSTRTANSGTVPW